MRRAVWGSKGSSRDTPRGRHAGPAQLRTTAGRSKTRPLNGPYKKYRFLDLLAWSRGSEGPREVHQGHPWAFRRPPGPSWRPPGPSTNQNKEPKTGTTGSATTILISRFWLGRAYREITMQALFDHTSNGSAGKQSGQAGGHGQIVLPYIPVPGLVHRYRYVFVCGQFHRSRLEEHGGHGPWEDRPKKASDKGF